MQVNSTRRLRALLAMSCLVVCGVLPLSVLGAESPTWKFATSSQGVRVYLKEVPGRAVPMFKGVTTIPAAALQVLAVLADVERSCEWNSACRHARLLRKKSDLQLLFHLRLKAPWPVSDRDAVLKTNARVRPDGKVIYATFRAVKSSRVKPASGVVRFPRLLGRYTLTAIGPKRTHVEYVIDSDSGGWLPKWVVKYATRKVPIATLAGLKRQSLKTTGAYDAFVARHTPKAARSK